MAQGNSHALQHQNQQQYCLHNDDIALIPKDLNDPRLRNAIDEALTARDPIRALNALIAQYGKSKQLGLALFVFNEMVGAGLSPTVYTYSNLINAFVRCGEVDRAVRCLDQMNSSAHVLPNEVTYTTIIKGFCTEGLIRQAIELMRGPMRDSHIRPNLRTYNTILRGCMRCGELKFADSVFDELFLSGEFPDTSTYEYLVKTLCGSLQVSDAWEIIDEMRWMGMNHPPVFSALATACALTGDVSGANRAIADAATALKDPRSMTYMHGDEETQRASLSQFIHLRNEEVERECQRVREYLNKLAQGNVPDPKLVPPISKSPNVIFYPSRDGQQQSLPSTMTTTTTTTTTTVFGRHTFGKRNKRPIRLEVCSGHGDWIVDRAQKDPSSYWVGLEIRYERVYQTWSKMVFNNVSNLWLLGGEAHAILENIVPADIFDEIFVNYPDPPIWEGSKQRLLDNAFFHQAHRALRSGCSIIIVTDNFLYCKQVSQALSQLSHIFKSAFDQPYLDKLPPGYGESYFDRMWSIGDRNRRYFLKYTKCQ